MKEMFYLFLDLHTLCELLTKFIKLISFNVIFTSWSFSDKPISPEGKSPRHLERVMASDWTGAFLKEILTVGKKGREEERIRSYKGRG